MSKPKVFITNDLAINDIDISRYEAVLDIEGKSLINIVPIALPDLVPDTDWIFFYSKNGIKHFFTQLTSSIEKFRYSSQKFATIGQQSSDYLLKEFGVSTSFVFDGNNSSELKKLIGRRRVLFPQGSSSKKTIEQLLPPDQCKPIFVYHNTPINDFKLHYKPNYLIITSPMNADAYLLRNRVDKNTTVITLGTTTANHLLDKYNIPSQYADIPAIEAALELIITQI